jgi:hypothetical protein
MGERQSRAQTKTSVHFNFILKGEAVKNKVGCREVGQNIKVNTENQNHDIHWPLI